MVIHSDHLLRGLILMTNLLTLKHSNETIRLYELVNAINDMLFNAKNEVHIFEEICRIVNEEGSFQSSWIGLFDKKTGIISGWCHLT